MYICFCLITIINPEEIFADILSIEYFIVLPPFDISNQQKFFEKNNKENLNKNLIKKIKRK